MECKTVKKLSAALAMAAAFASAARTVDLSGDGWTCEAGGVSKRVCVPSVVERHFTDFSTYDAPEKDGTQHDSCIVKEWLKHHGKSEWHRKFTFDAAAVPPGGRIVVRFEATRYFADIYVNGKFLHHDEAPDMPYEVDATEAVKDGENELLVKIDNPPGGDYDWRDFMPAKDPEGIDIPGGRAMSGVIGRVWLDVHDPVYIDDLWIANTPGVRTVDVTFSVTNSASAPAKRLVRLAVEPKGTVFEKEMEFAPGLTTVKERVDSPDAKLWDLTSPNLYAASLSVGTEKAEKTFGYRWIAPDGIGTNAILRLNGKRIVVRSAIGWGWYLGTGIVPSAEDAKREVAAAKALGQNAISFHRHNGQEVVLEEADRQGLLIYAEPGAFQSGKGTEHGHRINAEKVRRWIKAYRSHPSLFHWNLINELWGENEHLDGYFRESVMAAHELDPSRTVTLTSAWGTDGMACLRQSKMNMRPYDTNLYLNGWCDLHRACGPILAWNSGDYESPSKHYMHTDTRDEVKYWGEEGAFSAPPRLELIVRELDRRGYDGTDGRIFRVWAEKANAFLDRKGFRRTFPTLDDWCCALGAESLFHQGKMIEMMRMDDAADGYAVNGWESMTVENNSGIVDTMRNPKSDPAIMAAYNAPLRLAVMAKPVASAGSEAKVDVFIINEVDLKGGFRLVVEAKGPGGLAARAVRDVSVAGGDRYGEFLSGGIPLVLPSEGRYEISAALEGAPGAAGSCIVDAFDARAPKIPAGLRIAVAEEGDRLSAWLKEKGVPFEAYDPSRPADVVLVAASPRLDFANGTSEGAGKNEVDQFGAGIVAKKAEEKKDAVLTAEEKESALALLTRAAKDGARVVILQSAGDWAPLVAEESGIEFRGAIPMGTDWLGGIFFTKKDPLLSGFPSGGAVGSAYEDVAGERDRSMLLIEGEDCVMGGWQAEHCKLGTALGRIRRGDGEIVLSTLAVVRNLGKTGADRMMANFIEQR